MSDSIDRVGVIGAGQMGGGIAEGSARAGVDVLVYEPTEELTTAGKERITKSLERGVSTGKITERERDQALANLKFTTELKDLADRQLVIEAVIEDETVKGKIFAELDDIITDPDAVLASNTSSIPIMKNRCGNEESGPRARPALLQPGAGAAARRADQHTRHLRRRHRAHGEVRE